MTSRLEFICGCKWQRQGDCHSCCWTSFSQKFCQCPASYLNFLGFASPTGIASAAQSLWQEGRNPRKDSWFSVETRWRSLSIAAVSQCSFEMFWVCDPFRYFRSISIHFDLWGRLGAFFVGFSARAIFAALIIGGCKWNWGARWRGWWIAQTPQAMNSKELPQIYFCILELSELYENYIFQKLSVDASLTNIMYLHYLHSAVSLCTFAVSKATASGRYYW